MTKHQYSIVFRKEIEPGQAVEVVKGNLAKLFKADLEIIEKMFQRDSIVIKKGLTKEQAEKYREAVKKAGAVVYLLEESIEQNESNLDKVVGPKAIEATTSSSWTHLVEFKEFTPLDFDLKAYTLAPVGEQLVEEKVIESPKYEFKGIDFAAEGELLVEEAEVLPAEFDTQGLKLEDQ